jgi:hypothetical protein
MNEPSKEMVIFLTETEEWNDVMIFNSNGEHEFLFSRYRTLNDEVMDELKLETKRFIESLITPPNEAKFYKTEREYFYATGINLLGRHFKITRYNLPFIFGRDVNNHEELCIVKMKKQHTDYRFIIVITYFIDYSSSIIASYLKTFVENYETTLKVDDDHFNNIVL